MNWHDDDDFKFGIESDENPDGIEDDVFLVAPFKKSHIPRPTL